MASPLDVHQAASALSPRLLPLSIGNEEELTREMEKLAAHHRRSKLVVIVSDNAGVHEIALCRRLLTQEILKGPETSFLAAPWDWQDGEAIRRFVRKPPAQFVDSSTLTQKFQEPFAVLHRLFRWPSWIWANTQMLNLVTWMAEVNASGARERKHILDFLALDLYSFYSSRETLLQSAEELGFKSLESLSEDSVEKLVGLLESKQVLRAELLNSGGAFFPDPQIQKKVSNRLMLGAESYFRTLIRDPLNFPKVRDRHLFDVLKEFLIAGKRGVLWCDTSQLGQSGLVDLLHQSDSEDDAVSVVGLSCAFGEAIAAPSWGEPYSKVRFEFLNGETLQDVAHLALKQREFAAGVVAFRKEDRQTLLDLPIEQRSLGPIHRENQSAIESHKIRIAQTYDSLVCVDEGSPLEPLHVPFRPIQFNESTSEALE